MRARWRAGGRAGLAAGGGGALRPRPPHPLPRLHHSQPASGLAGPGCGGELPPGQRGPCIAGRPRRAHLGLGFPSGSWRGGGRGGGRPPAANFACCRVLTRASRAAGSCCRGGGKERGPGRRRRRRQQPCLSSLWQLLLPCLGSAGRPGLSRGRVPLSRLLQRRSQYVCRQEGELRGTPASANLLEACAR